MEAAKLRHRVTLQQPINGRDSFGGVVPDWQDVADLWAAIEPISAREFIASAAEQSKVTTRITIRARPGVTAKMRIYHTDSGKYYNIEGVLSDKESGKDYYTLPCSEGVRGDAP